MATNPIMPMNSGPPSVRNAMGDDAVAIRLVARPRLTGVEDVDLDDLTIAAVLDHLEGLSFREHRIVTPLGLGQEKRAGGAVHFDLGKLLPPQIAVPVPAGLVDDDDEVAGRLRAIEPAVAEQERGADLPRPDRTGRDHHERASRDEQREQRLHTGPAPIT